uniref:Uncharacterized protein n=1 Tax=Mola mola TaxID=94237 RepID=A0A3Q3XE59_MOLML
EREGFCLSDECFGLKRGANRNQNTKVLQTGAEPQQLTELFLTSITAIEKLRIITVLQYVSYYIITYPADTMNNKCQRYISDHLYCFFPLTLFQNTIMVHK